MKTIKCTIINPANIPTNKSNTNGSQITIDGAIIIDKSGIILYSGAYEDIPEEYSENEIIDYTNFIAIPGLIDLHNHVPQYPNTGVGNGELLDWLNNHIFPLEAKYDDYDFAYSQALEYFKSAIKYGTTTIVSYSTSSETATDSAFSAAKESGINAFIGNTMMDTNSPHSIMKSTVSNIKITEKMINKYHRTESGKLNYILTPRFAGTCSFELLKQCGEIAKVNDLYIQTHLAENKGELKFIKSIFPDFDNYTDIYNKSGILTDKTLLAHCIYLDSDELKMIKDKSSAICHCPSSNMYLKSGIMPFSKYIREDFKIGLGTDVAGGTSLSMFNEMSACISASKLYQTLIDSDFESISADRAFYHSTLNSAKILNIDKKCGSIDKGKEADIIFIKKNRIFNKNIQLDNEDLISKIIYSISNNYVDKTMLRGELLHEYK